MEYLIPPFTNPVLIIATLMGIMLVVPILFDRLQIPSIIGLILSGIFIGPNTLGILERDATIVLLGTIGLLYIMFIAGLEIDLNEFNKSRGRSLTFGALTFLLPQIIGTLIGVYFLNYSWPTSILLASLFASHTLLAYPVVSRMGLAKNNAVIVAVGGTIITDTAALLVLAVIAGSAQGEINALFWATLGISLTVYTFLMLWGIPRLGRWFFRTSNGGGVSEFLFVLVVVFVAAFFAEVAGVEHIIGAFLAGLTLNRLIPEHSPLMNRLEFVGNALFIPFFLISVGMLVDPQALFTGWEAWIVALAMVITVSVTKYLAAFGTQKFFGYSVDERNLIFGLSVPQAAATLAAVLVGYQIGLFNDDVLNGSIVMILVTCFIGSLVAERSARNILVAQEEDLPEQMERPQRVMVPMANPANIDRLLEVAILIREPGALEPVQALFVLTDIGKSEQIMLQNEKKMAPALREAQAANVPLQIINRLDVSPGRGIIRAAAEVRATDLVIGWNGKISRQERIFGSVLDRIVGNSRQQLMVCKLAHPLSTFEKIGLLLPPNVEHEPGFPDLMHTIKRMAQQIGVTIWALHAEAGAKSVRRMLEQIAPDVEMRFQTYSELADVSKFWNNIIDDDLIILMGARRNTVSWQPALDKLPGDMARRLPERSFMIVYPGVESDVELSRYNLMPM
jgi:Kef-type K+ transport system membrane component KefB/nucleotide-binding universal stress UspA family protein